jgi:nitrogen-specific signal transduction histidine kinase
MNSNSNPSTYFAPAGRARANVIDFQRGRIKMEGILAPVLDAIPDCAFVLNEERQILIANRRLLDLYEGAGNEIIGKRVGEVLGCLHAGKGPDGCSTGIHCTTCGAGFAVVESQEKNARISSECRLTVGKGNAVSCLDLQVVASPVTIADISLTMCVMKDISAEKRRRVLEKVFFHDLMNTVSGISSVIELLADEYQLDSEDEQRYRYLLVDLTNRLVDEINHQRKLLAAEIGEFKPELALVEVRALMEGVRDLYAGHNVARGRNLVLGEIAERTIISDAAILRRVLGNLVKNALEAVAPGETVTMSCVESEREITFLVHNRGSMSREVQLQIFQRSFSTKGENGRGIGTYSVKLFGEGYLKGKVTFTSSEQDGTVFSLSLPESPEDPAE